MKTPNFGGRMLAAVFLCLISVAVSNAAEVPRQTDAGLAKARSMVKAGQFEQARTLLRLLTQADPGRQDVRFLLGLTAMTLSQRPDVPEIERVELLDEAIAYLHGMLIAHPGLVRVRLELARAFFYKGEDGLAREHFERVLAGNPPAPVVANIRRFLSQIRGRRRWRGHLGFAVAPDTNIGGTSNERIIYIFGLPFRRDAESLTTSGVGLSVWGGGEYQQPLGDRLRLRMGIDVSRKEYSGSRFDSMQVSWHAGPRVFVSRTTEFSVLGNWRHQWSANEANYFDVGGRLTMRHRLSGRLTVSGSASWHDRRYRARKDLEGPVRSLSLSAGWVLTPTVRLNASAGYGRDRPESRRSRNKSLWLRMGVSVALPKGFTVGGSGGVRWTDYEAPWLPHTPPDERREDEIYNVRASVHNRALTFFGFSPEVSLLYEVRKTNAQLYDYKRTGGELRVVRQF